MKLEDGKKGDSTKKDDNQAGESNEKRSGNDGPLDTGEVERRVRRRKRSGSGTDKRFQLAGDIAALVASCAGGGD